MKRFSRWWGKRKKKIKIETPVEKTLYILAGTYQQAVSFAQERGLRFSDWKYISLPWGLKGVDGKSAVLVAHETFWDRDDIEEFLAEIWVSRLRLYNAPD